MRTAYNRILAASRRKYGDGAKRFEGKSGNSEICPIFGGHTNFYGQKPKRKGANGESKDFIGSISSCECCENVAGTARLKTVWYSKAYDSASRPGR